MAAAPRPSMDEPGEPFDTELAYAKARALACQGQHHEARLVYVDLKRAIPREEKFSRLRALIHNDLAVLAALDGQFDEARAGWQSALETDGECRVALLNRDLVEAEIKLGQATEDVGELKLAPAPDQTAPGLPQSFSDGDARLVQSFGRTDMLARTEPRPPGSLERTIRVAILSFLFNWPSTGGGNHHTAELAAFLARAGYEVKHYFVRYPGWGIGRVTDELISPSEPIEFDEPGWNVAEIQARFRRAVETFGPDYLIITDSWNMKPLLAEAVRGYPFFLLYQAMENICPLNNLRLLATGPDQVAQCPRNQLATPDVCCRCLAERGRHSGALHRAERELAGVGTREYDQKLRASLGEAEAVLALNPVIAAMLEPYSSRVCIVPWGMDPERFPWPVAEGSAGAHVTTLFMAAVAGETIKGYHIAHAACRILRQSRSDFELVVTFDPAGPIDEFTRSVGWCSLADLPRHYRAADICLVPTIAQDSLSRTSVEAMASGIPVVASRIGGLPYTVTDGVTGLLCEPSNPADLARQIGRLLDDQPLRRQMGLAGRKRFEEGFIWGNVIERHFRSLLGSPTAVRFGNRSGSSPFANLAV